MTTLQNGSESPNDPNDPRSNDLRQRRRRSSSLNLAESQVRLPRLIARNLPYHQSHNKMAVQSVKNHSHVYPLLLRDWFHVFLRLPTYFSVTLLLSVWTLFILIFAGIYVGIDTSNNLVDCGLGDPGFPIKWGTAFAFSLETCTTVGCKQPLFLFSCDVLLFVMLICVLDFPFLVYYYYYRWIARSYQCILRGKLSECSSDDLRPNDMEYDVQRFSFCFLLFDSFQK